MKPIVISKYEWEVLALFVVGLIPAIFILHWNFPIICMVYIAGMTFEMLTNSFWNYNPVMEKSTFTLHDREVSLIFGLGWVGNISFGITGGYFIHNATGWPFIFCCAIGSFVLGNALEYIFLKLGLWQYNLTSWMATYGTGKPIMVGPIPFSVFTGYPITGMVAYSIVYILGKQWFLCP